MCHLHLKLCTPKGVFIFVLVIDYVIGIVRFIFIFIIGIFIIKTVIFVLLGIVLQREKPLFKNIFQIFRKNGSAKYPVFLLLVRK